MEQRQRTVAHDHPLTFQGAGNTKWWCHGVILESMCTKDNSALRWKCIEENCDFNLC